MSRTIPYLELFGDELENFYQLGIRDRIGHKDLYDQSNKLIPLRDDRLSNLIKNLGKEYIKSSLKKNSSFFKKVEAYAEGLDRPLKDVLFSLMIPDILGSVNAATHLPFQHLFGCSSLFFFDEQNQCPSHLRILDFPLIGSFDENERVLKTNFYASQKVVTLNCAGIPFSSPTSINESGVSLALHQHFGDDQNFKEGVPIFELSHKYIHEVENLKDARSFLRHHKPIAHWSFYSSFPNGTILRAEVSPKESYFKEYKCSPNSKELLYFCNRHKNSQKQNEMICLENYNAMRERSAEKKIQKIKKLKHINAQTVLKNISLPLASHKKWNLDLITPSSLQVCVLQAKEGRILLNTGIAPRFHQNQVLELSNTWKNRHRLSSLKSKGKAVSSNYLRGYRELALAQKAYDDQNVHLQFHHIQMAKCYLKDHAEHLMADFFFLIYSFLYAEQPRHYKNLIQKFSKIVGELPPYYQDHCHIFLQRCSLILGEPYKEKHQFTHKRLEDVFKSESTLPWQFIMKHLIFLMTHPRIDLFDVFYFQIRPETLENLKSLIKI